MVTPTTMTIWSGSRALPSWVTITTSSMPEAVLCSATWLCGSLETMLMALLRGTMNSRKMVPCTFPIPMEKRRLLNRMVSFTLRLMEWSRQMGWTSWMVNTTMQAAVVFWLPIPPFGFPASTIWLLLAVVISPLTQTVSLSRLALLLVEMPPTITKTWFGSRDSIKWVKTTTTLTQAAARWSSMQQPGSAVPIPMV